jgi:pimeloyl-ACP methyl ester carboxylesterase
MATISVNGVDLAYEERGTGDGILLIHGTGGNVWGELPDLLASEARVVNYDRRSFGGSTHPPIKNLAQHSRDAAALIEALDLGPATVVGHSMGGVISLDLALNRPELVRTLLLVEPPLHFAKHPTPSMMRNLIGGQLAGRRRGPEAGAERFMRWATTTTDGRNGYDSMPDEERVKLLGNSAAILRELQAGTGEHMKPREFASISCPAVCLVGAITLPEYGKAAQRLAKALPGLRIITVPGAGHVLPVTHPRAVVEALRDVRDPARAS